MLALGILEISGWIIAQVRTQPQTLSDPITFSITFSGWLMTAISATIAIFQYRRTKKITQRSKEELLGFIGQSNYISSKLELIDEITKNFSDTTLLRHLTSSQQAGIDLYKTLVNYYLSLEESFTYEDLKKIRKTPIVSYEWQEASWISFICLRKENKQKDTPGERHLNAGKPSRT